MGYYSGGLGTLSDNVDYHLLEFGLRETSVFS